MNKHHNRNGNTIKNSYKYMYPNLGPGQPFKGCFIHDKVPTKSASVTSLPLIEHSILFPYMMSNIINLNIYAKLSVESIVIIAL